MSAGSLRELSSILVKRSKASVTAKIFESKRWLVSDQRSGVMRSQFRMSRG